MVTEKEKQHYVPKFFLRRFSCFGDDKTIGIYRPKNGLFVASGPLRSQAYRRYFYGKDGVLENQLSQVEGVSAEVLRQIAVRKEQFGPGTLHHHGALVHLLLSDARTPAHVERLQQQLNSAHAVAFAGVEKLPREAKKLIMTQEMALRFAMDFLKDGVELCQDLEVRIVKNQTAIPFITCDTPVLRYNQLLEQHRQPGGIIGTAHAGLQLFMPIDSRTMLVAFDGDYYKVGARTNARLSFCNDRDVEQLNMLTLLNCHSAVFFNHEIGQDYLVRLAAKAAAFPPPNQTVVTKLYNAGRVGHETLYTVDEPADYPSVLLHTYATSLKVRLVLSFIQFTRAYRRFLPDRIPGNMRPHCAQIYLRDRAQAGPRATVKFTYDAENEDASQAPALLA
jgi:Protein of unknown function (DUF4238)